MGANKALFMSDRKENSFQFVTPVTYRNSFIDLQDTTTDMNDQIAQEIDRYYEDLNDLMLEDE